MAYLFDGTNDYGQVALNLSGSNILSVAALVYWDNYANDDDLALEFTANGASTPGGFFIDPNGSGGNFNTLVSQNGAGFREQKHFTRPSSDVWQSWVFVFDSSAAGGSKIAAIYIDGVSQTLTTTLTGSSTENFANDTLNIMCRNGASLFAAGRMAELALWSGVTLNQAQASMLAARYSPMMIGSRPTHYFPMVRDGNSRTSAASISFTGAVVTDHPRVIYPRRARTHEYTAAAAGSTIGLLRANAGLGGGPFSLANAGVGAIA